MSGESSKGRLYMDLATSRFATHKETGEEPRVLRIAWWAEEAEHPTVRIIRPLPETTADPATFRYHGITLDYAHAHGVDPAGVIEELEAATRGVRTIVSFNQEFHWRNLHRLMGRAGAEIPTTAVCAMRWAAPFLAIPDMRPRGTMKMPSLAQCCDHFEIVRPGGDTPYAIADSTVRAVRAVFEACTKETPHG